MEPSSPTATSPGREAVFDLALFIKTPDPSPSPGAKGFLDLPPELRLRIYGYLTTDFVNYDDPEPQPGARVLPSIALALTCHQVYKEHIAGALAAYSRYPWNNISGPRGYGTIDRCLAIELSPDYPSSRVLKTLGIDVVDHFDKISIVGKREAGTPWGELWLWDGGWYGREVQHQITLAGGSLAFGWQGDPEAFYRRATFEKMMERADYWWKYEETNERMDARRQHPALFLEYVHPSACAPENLQMWEREWPGSVFHCRSRGPKQHELGPITFNFTNATRQNAATEATSAGPKLESKFLHNEEVGTNHYGKASPDHDEEARSSHADNVNQQDCLHAGDRYQVHSLHSLDSRRRRATRLAWRHGHIE
jgi:hypothetical protein